MTARFFTITDSRFFVGTVGLLNSLRLTGNDEELVVLDRGLTPEQRERLNPHVTLFDLPDEIEASAYAVKPYPARMDVGGIVVVIDSDVIVTNRLEPYYRAAGDGKICMFPSHFSAEWRFFEEWSEIFGLAAPLRRDQPYLAAGYLAISMEKWPSFFERWWKACELLPTPPPPRDDTSPLGQLDQDALNAILMSEIPADAIEELPAFEFNLSLVKVVDEKTLACRDASGAVPLLHTTRSPKVWQPEGWRHVEGITRAFVRLMPRVLFADDVPLNLSRREVPVWLRGGIPSRVLARTISAYNHMPWVLRRTRRIPARTVREARGLIASLRKSET